MERHRLQREKNAGAYMEPASDGNWVTYSDHAAAMSKITEELDELRAALRDALAAHSDHAAELARVEGQRDAAREECEIKRKHLCEHVADMTAVSMQSLRVEEELRDVQKQNDANRRLLNKALKENTILRAECEAWRAFRKAQTDGLCSDVGDAIVATFRYAELLDAVDAARAATDAAGILKGAE